MIAYGEDGDKLGFAEVLGSRVLALRHLYDQTEDSDFLILAKHTAMAAVEIAEESKDQKALGMPYRDLAKSLDTLGEYDKAAEYYQKALDSFISNPPEEHKMDGRTAMIADLKVHLYITEVKSGKMESIAKAEAAAEELASGQEISKYNKDVWLSGAYMRLAEVLKDIDLEKAKMYLQKSKEIIDANEELKIRKSQWEKLAASFFK